MIYEIKIDEVNHPSFMNESVYGGLTSFEGEVTTIDSSLCGTRYKYRVTLEEIVEGEKRRIAKNMIYEEFTYESLENVPFLPDRLLFGCEDGESYGASFEDFWNAVFRNTDIAILDSDGNFNTDFWRSVLDEEIERRARDIEVRIINPKKLEERRL